MVGKNTAEFTVQDFIKFTKWWVQQEIRQEIRKDVLSVTPAQRATYEKDVQAMNKYRAAQTSRLPADKTAEDIENEVEEMSKEVENEVIVEMGLTKIDVEALVWALDEIFENYDLTGSVHDKALSGLLEALKGVRE
jgi:flagellar motor switch/type III secretory pathway protein FliN